MHDKSWQRMYMYWHNKLEISQAKRSMTYFAEKWSFAIKIRLWNKIYNKYTKNNKVAKFIQLNLLENFSKSFEQAFLFPAILPIGKRISSRQWNLRGRTVKAAVRAWINTNKFWVLTPQAVADPEGGQGAMAPQTSGNFFDITYITLTSLVVLVHSFRY